MSNTIMCDLVVTGRTSHWQWSYWQGGGLDDGHHLALPLHNSFSEVQIPVVPWPSGGADILSSTSCQLRLFVASVS